MWLSGLHIPESYLTALVQATCRKNGWPLDKSTLYTTVTHYINPDDVTERAHQGNTMFLCVVHFTFYMYVTIIHFVSVDDITEKNDLHYSVNKEGV